MLRWAVSFFVLAVAFGAVGFGGVAPDLAAIGQVGFVVFILLATIALGRRTNEPSDPVSARSRRRALQRARRRA